MAVRQVRKKQQTMKSLVVLLVSLGVFSPQVGRTSASQLPAPAPVAAVPTLADAHRLFYNARYDAAAELTLALTSVEAEELAVNLATRELRTSALLFQVRRAIGSAKDKDKALKQCAACGAMMDAFQVETARGLDSRACTAEDASR